MDANPQEGAVSLELLARTSVREFVTAYLTAHGVSESEYVRNANGSRSSAATIEEFCGRWGEHKHKAGQPIDGITLAMKVCEGGGEGEGESVYRVYAILKDGVEIAYFSVNGYYASEYGTDFEDDFTTVYPRQVMVTQYFTTKE